MGVESLLALARSTKASRRVTPTRHDFVVSTSPVKGEVRPSVYLLDALGGT